jgi:hypothetical protein
MGHSSQKLAGWQQAEATEAQFVAGKHLGTNAEVAAWKATLRGADVAKFIIRLKALKLPPAQEAAGALTWRSLSFG